jgi:N-acetylated-alpha-linked acidic dipeptidase
LILRPQILTGFLGSTFGTSSAPLINGVLQETLKLVPSPNQTIPGQSVYDLWSKKISTIGSGSDYTAFQDFAGVPSVDMGFHTAKPGPVYHYHSNYDSFYWMDTYGDPG